MEIPHPLRSNAPLIVYMDSFHPLSYGRITWLLRRNESAVCELAAR